uniref:Serine aminopeptidase S33 domain-containing protein n=2 Tax=Corethron hystrix TaxID=216773 RepID=A0A7S1B464_9STRA|mmetsp:Transcript_12315/g.26943  ORF Transcript_12315/g.26943 Transcript_12315/m.26943 type:complete len:334 (+) Transcript_12315:122-1123(+)
MVQPPNVSLETSVSRSAAFKYCFVLFLAYRCIGAIPFLTLTSLLSFVIPHLFRTNDDPVERRKLMNNWKDREVKVFSGDDEIDVREEYVVNKRAMCLMSTTMRPLRRPIKAVLCFCHGYADNPYNLTRWAYRLLVYAGYAMVILEYEGHGRSDGLLGFIPSWDLLVDDAVTHFRNVLKKERDFRQKKCFLVGESMGGAVCFSSYLKCPNFWDGIIFVAPMCKISEEVKPPQWVIDLLLKIIGPSGSINFFGKLPLSPSSDYDELIFKDKLVLQAFREVPTAYNRKPRLATARELLVSDTLTSCRLYDPPSWKNHWLYFIPYSTILFFFRMPQI